MIVSEARLAANRINGPLGKGPSEEGRLVSRKNGLKHGLTGKGVVLPEGDADEVARRAEALTADMNPRTEAGTLLISQIALLSFRAERAAEYEFAAIARNVRHAADAFDEGRIEAANEVFGTLHDDPRTALRKLRKSPEGVARLFDAWTDLRTDLTNDPEPIWADEQLVEAALLSGLKERHAKGSRLGVLTRALRGDFGSLTDQDGAGLNEDARKGWAKATILGHVDAELAELEAHYLTLDFETIEVDRDEAGRRALFDHSKEASRFRRYESEARRGFLKALKEFRQVEAEFAAQAEANAARPSAPGSGVGDPRMGSSREISPHSGRYPAPTFPGHLSGVVAVAPGPNGEVVRAVDPTKTPR